MASEEENMKKLSLIWRRLIMPSFAIFTALTISLSVFMSLAGVTDKPALTLSALLTLYLMAFLIAASSLIFYVGKLSVFVRTVINFFLTLISITVSALIGNYQFGMRSLLLVIVYTVIYLVFVPASILIYTIIKRRLSEDTEYTGVFRKDK